MKPILFIHGFGGGRYEYKPIIRYLKEKGFSKFYEFTYKERFGTISLDDLAKRISVFSEEKVKEKSIDIIGISQGGIIARNYIQNYNTSKNIKKCITICSPHHGSLSAYLLPLKGSIELRPKSKFLEKIIGNKSDKTDYYCIYTPFDLMVIPGWSGKLPNAKENKAVYAPLHPLAFWCRSTLDFIYNSLKK